MNKQLEQVKAEIERRRGMKTGHLIEAIMHYKHFGVGEIANKIGIPESSMSTLIAGRRSITPTLAKKIGDVLDIDPLVIMTNRMCEELQKGE